MAKINNRNGDSFSVQGRVFDVTTKQGIGDLLVTAYNLNNGFARTANSDLESLLKNSTRVGSVVSNETGSFKLNYDRIDITALQNEKQRLDLLVVIAAPEDDKNGSAEKVIYYSNPPLFNAGRVETINVGVSRGTVEKFGLGDA